MNVLDSLDKLHVIRVNLYSNLLDAKQLKDEARAERLRKVLIHVDTLISMLEEIYND